MLILASSGVPGALPGWFFERIAAAEPDNGANQDKDDAEKEGDKSNGHLVAGFEDGGDLACDLAEDVSESFEEGGKVGGD